MFLGINESINHLSWREIVFSNFWLGTIIIFVLQHYFIHRIKKQETFYSGTSSFQVAHCEKTCDTIYYDIVSNYRIIFCKAAHREK